MINKLFYNNNHLGVQNDSAHDVSTQYKSNRDVGNIIIIVNVIGNCINYNRYYFIIAI